jgi:predicted TIM-barrel fold metal-dependent hydrolase
MDLSVTLDALAELGDRARGIAMLRSEVTDATLRKLHAAGMRGVRLSMAYGAETPLDAAHLRLWSERVAPLGWHIAMWPSDLEQLRLLERLADHLPTPLVLDHLASHGWFVEGRVLQEGLGVLDGLLASGKAWLKLSGMYRAGANAAPWEALIDPVSQLAHKYLHRMLWASDWPYVGLHDPLARPTSASLLDWLRQLGLGDAQRTQILVQNPEQLYGFPAR